MRTADARNARRDAMLALLRSEGELSVADLAARFAVTGATVRSDLSALASERKVIRTHGGAAVIDQAQPVELPLARRLRIHSAEKERIAALAATLVRDRDVVAFDASSSSLAVARALRERESLTVVTPSLEAAQLFLGRPQHTVLIPGGTVRHEMASIVGEQVVPFLEALRVRVAFIGAHAIDVDRGLCDLHPVERAIKQALVRIAAETVALIDSSKWHATPMTPFLPLEQVQTLVTDDGTSAERVAAVEARGVRVVVA